MSRHDWWLLVALAAFVAVALVGWAIGREDTQPCGRAAPLYIPQ